MKKQDDEAWLAEVSRVVQAFCSDYRVVYAVKRRERAASFEIGCLHMLLRNYEEVGSLFPENLNEKREFRYLTSPNGNPENFSWIRLHIDGEDFEIRQQVRVKSHWHDDVAFCPDIVVLKPGTKVEADFDEDYANGKRKFFVVSSEQVVSAHECKSLSPFPELLEVVSKVSDEDHGASELEESAVIFDPTFVAHQQPAPVAEPSKKALDLPAVPVTPQRSSVLQRGTLPVAPMGTNEFAIQVTH